MQVYYYVILVEEDGSYGPQYRLAPPGQEGELFIGGDCVAKGYLNAPTLTAEVQMPLKNS